MQVQIEIFLDKGYERLYNIKSGPIRELLEDGIGPVENTSQRSTLTERHRIAYRDVIKVQQSSRQTEAVAADTEICEFLELCPSQRSDGAPVVYFRDEILVVRREYHALSTTAETLDKFI